MKRGGGGRRTPSPSPNGRKAGRPEGSVSYSGKGMMTRYNRPNTGGMTMRLPGKKASANGMHNLKGRASSTNYTGDPNVRRKSN